MGRFPGLLGSQQFAGRDTYVLGGDQLSFFMGGGDEGAAGEVVGSPQHPTGSLVDGGDRLLGVELVGDAGDLQVVVEVGLHLLTGESFEVAAGDDARSQGQ
jgi:hypothetical protein